MSGFSGINENPTNGQKMLPNGQVFPCASPTAGYIADKPKRFSMIVTSFVNSATQRRLGCALTTSLLIHLSFIIGISTSLFVPNDTTRQTASLHAYLRPPALPSKAQTSVPWPIVGAPPIRQTNNLPAEHTIPARFIIEPDLGTLRDIPVSLGGRVHFRLHVSSIGTISAIETLEHDPLPLDLLDGLKDSLTKTLLHPAEHAGKAVDSTLDITVWFEPVTVP